MRRVRHRRFHPIAALSHVVMHQVENLFLVVHYQYALLRQVPVLPYPCEYCVSQALQLCWPSIHDLYHNLMKSPSIEENSLISQRRLSFPLASPCAGP